MHDSPAGWLRAKWQPQGNMYSLVGLEFCGETSPAEAAPPPHQTAADLDAALQDFFAGGPVPAAWLTPTLTGPGTPFQRQVWQALTQIPRGQVRSYGQIAASLGKPRAMRAVAQACRRNPVCLLIPCHRVVGQSGKKYVLGGFMGGTASGEALKRRLLAMEGCVL